jgi:dTDP-4-amino-4,6-dideoxygalactose transaminase
MHVPFVDLKAQYQSIQKDIDCAIKKVIEETTFIGGHFVHEFETNFSALYGVRNMVACANGTDSLYILMKMLGIGPGDEVLTTANSWISSAETVTQTGAKVVFADVHPRYYSMNESQLESKINSKTKAVIAVHLQGQMCAIDSIKSICDNHGIYLIEDCAQSHFSEYKGKRAGLFGVAGSFSFYPGKNLGAYGDAGGIITNDDELATKCRMFARHGGLQKNQHLIEGVNSRLDSLQAAILGAKLPHILEWNEKRIRNASLYNQYLSDITEIILPEQRPESRHTYHLYVIRSKKRTELMQYLKGKNIETAIHYPLALPNLPAYKYLGHQPSDFPVASQLQDEILSLPMYPELTEEMICRVATTIKEFYKRAI